LKDVSLVNHQEIGKWIFLIYLLSIVQITAISKREWFDGPTADMLISKVLLMVHQTLDGIIHNPIALLPKLPRWHNLELAYANTNEMHAGYLRSVYH